MAPTTLTTRTYPKRKRADISYHEASSDEDEADEEYTASNQNQPTAKVRQSIINLWQLTSSDYLL